MIIEFLYPFILLILIFTVISLSIGLWFWYKHKLWELIDKLEEWNDRIFYWAMDKIMGCKGEID